MNYINGVVINKEETDSDIEYELEYETDSSVDNSDIEYEQVEENEYNKKNFISVVKSGNKIKTKLKKVLVKNEKLLLENDCLKIQIEHLENQIKIGKQRENMTRIIGTFLLSVSGILFYVARNKHYYV